MLRYSDKPLSKSQLRAMVKRTLRWLESPGGREALAESKRRCEEFAEHLKSTRPTKETWDWTPTI
jgi:hypothetical protein